MPDSTGQMYVAHWPIERVLPGETHLTWLYGFRSPWAQDACRQCKSPLAKGELCVGCNYYDEEVGYYLCMGCAEPMLAPERVSRLRPDGLEAVDQLELTVVASHCSPELSDPQAILLAPHSDNGMPRPRTKTQTRDVDVVLDAGKPVVVSRVRVHNWYFGAYPKRVEVFGFESLDDGPEGQCRIGAGRLRKASVWAEVDCTAQGEAAFRYFRLRFPEILEPSEHSRMKLGVVLLD